MKRMTSSGSSGAHSRRARAMSTRALGVLVRRSFVAFAAWRRRQEETRRRAAALDELSQRSDSMLRDIGSHRSQLFVLREGRR